MWLRDFLPFQVPYTRIMSYGYDSQVAFSKSELELGDVAADVLDRLDGERGKVNDPNEPLQTTRQLMLCTRQGIAR